MSERKRLFVWFLSGLLAGGALGWWGARNCLRDGGWHGPGRYERMLKRFSSKLDLSPEQRAQVAALLEAKRQKIKSLRAEIRPRFDEIRGSTKAEIRKLLSPDQQVKFDALQAKWEEKWEKRRRSKDE